MISALVSSLIAVPALGAVAMLAAGVRANQWATRFGVAVSGGVFVLAVLCLAMFDYSNPVQIQGGVSFSWVGSLGWSVHFGIDGLSLPLIAMSALLFLLCSIYSVRNLPDGGSPRAYVGLFLLLEMGVLGTFASLDLISFFVFFEFVLIPMWFVIAWWGSGDARRYANTFILYTVAGSVVMLAGFMWLWSAAGTTDLTLLAARAGNGLSTPVQLSITLLVGLGLAVKTPVWPFHSWLPDAHTSAPTAASVLLAGVLLKLGTYGMVRILIPSVPDGMRAVAPYLAALGVVGIVYGAAASYAQRDLKRLIAFSSVAHMGFIVLGIATLTTVGVNGAMFGNVAHGLITGMLFFLTGSIMRRYGTLDLLAMPRSLYARAPRLGVALAFAAVASLGLPGLAGFWGEFLPMVGAFQPAVPYNSLYRVLLVIAAMGTVFAAAYLLRVVRRVSQGPSTTHRLADVDRVEATIYLPLSALIVVLGLVPVLLLGITGPVVARSLVSYGNAAGAPETFQVVGVPR